MEWTPFQRAQCYTSHYRMLEGHYRRKGLLVLVLMGCIFHFLAPAAQSHSQEYKGLVGREGYIPWCSATSVLNSAWIPLASSSSLIPSAHLPTSRNSPLLQRLFSIALLPHTSHAAGHSTLPESRPWYSDSTHTYPWVYQQRWNSNYEKYRNHWCLFIIWWKWPHLHHIFVSIT